MRTFAPPEDGVWELESAHAPRPVSTFGQAPIERAIPRGFRTGTARYGLLLDTIEVRFVNGFAYTRRIPVGTSPGKPPRARRPPKLIFQLALQLNGSVRERIRISEEAIAKKFWREDLARWDDCVRPEAVRKHLAIQAIDPARLADAALVEHIFACREHMEEMIATHYGFAIACYLPVGDFIASVQQWTGKSAGEILHALGGSTRVSLGVAQAELRELVRALLENIAARAILDSKDLDPHGILQRLSATPGPVGEAMREYLKIISFRCVGYDVSSKYALELPEALVRALRVAVSEPARDATDPEAAIERLRSAVPEAQRAAFDELLAEARHVNRLRDERGHYCDGWATGLTRRALLEGGRRLFERDLLPNHEQIVDLTGEEIAALLDGARGPSVEEISARAAWRMTKSVSDSDVPHCLGGEPRKPPPLDWLPKGARRSQLAVFTFLDTLWTEDTRHSTAACMKGLPVSPGVYEGVARLVHDEVDFGRIHKGDVLVTRATSPYFNLVLPLLGAIVTDRGGQLCHAAIVSREYGIPGVVGTRNATSFIKDGARVRVNGDTGEVHLIDPECS
ncbi:MAG: PEP-utilizing enzyme [Pseudomonadota bacterium]